MPPLHHSVPNLESEPFSIYFVDYKLVYFCQMRHFMSFCGVPLLAEEALST